MKQLMKKTAVLLAAIVMLSAMAACGEQNAPAQTQAPAPSQSQETAEPSQTPETSPSQEPEPSEETAYTYTSQTYGFTVTMPESWQEDCEIIEENMAVTFCSKANRHLNYGDVEYDAGVLFTVVVPEDDMKDGQDGYVYPSYEVIGEYEGADMLVIYPTDVQFNTEDETAREEYNRMLEESADVISSIVFG